jgi:Domain of unknown function (DUF5615)
VAKLSRRPLTATDFANLGQPRSASQVRKQCLNFLCGLAATGTRGTTRSRMSLDIFVDMNQSHEWISFLKFHAWGATHWSDIGDPRARDIEIMRWARANERAVFTHDLDFGTSLALPHEKGRLEAGDPQ